MPGLSDFPDGDVSYFMRVIGEIPLTLTNIISANPRLFYDQVWYRGEAFMERVAEPLPGLPQFEQWGFPYLFPQQAKQRVSAASLAWLYVQNPDAPIWNRALWTDDLDSNGDRVYVGMKGRTGRFEIHRYLTITSNFGLPVWK